MVAKDRQNKTDSPKVEVGEIDTRAPFQSVKDAVNLFGEGAFSGEKNAIKKIKPQSAEVRSFLVFFSFDYYCMRVFSCNKTDYQTGHKVINICTNFFVEGVGEGDKAPYGTERAL